jgi:hypothetical protein
LLLIALCVLSLADPARGEDEVRGLYGGVKGQGLFADSASDLRVVWGVGGVIGYEFPYRLAIEGELTTPLEEGSVDPGGLDGEWEADTGALWGVWRSRGTAYFKARAGWAWRDVDIEPDINDESGEDDGPAASLGFGFEITRRVRLEWDLTWLDSDYYSTAFTVLF